MGKLINGINGPFLGKVGTAMGSSWKGIPYIKGPYKKRTGKVSGGEKGNRNKFATAQRWLQSTSDWLLSHRIAAGNPTVYTWAPWLWDELKSAVE